MRLFIASIACLFCASALALSSDNPVVISNIEFPIPDQYLLVNDYFGLLTIARSVEINKKLQALEKHNGTQIVYMSVPSTGKLDIRDYAIKVANKWDLGNNGQGNGVLFLVCQDGNMYIYVGPGVAGALPDVKIARIFRDIAAPHFKLENYSEGIEATLDELIKAAKWEDTTPTFYNYLDATGYYFSPFLSIFERVKMLLTLERVLIGALVLFGVLYAAGLMISRRKKDRTAN
ncbi:TPM domain-containing protein [Undibacterium parvum]|nr:TPM domain-containing protein [Undibacterium parvum]